MLLESAIGCNDPTKLASYKQKFELFMLDAEDIQKYREALTDDAIDTYYKGVLTLTEALSAISKGYQSWAIIKLYYATFYLIRVFLATRGYALVRCNKWLYTLRIEANESVVGYSGAKLNGQDVRGDHKTSIYLFQKMFGDEIILTNLMNGETVFDWMMSAREDVNYKHNTFSEPGIDFFDALINSEEGLIEWIKNYINDHEGIYIFQERHCCIATPIHLLVRVRHEMNSRLGVECPLTEQQYESLSKLMHKTGLDTSSALQTLLYK
ncbi:hypothetical protein [Pseudomonas graminis]